MKRIKLFLAAIVVFAHSGYSQFDAPVAAPGGDKGEAHIVINPTDSNKMVIGCMNMLPQTSFKIYHSSDAGNTWTPSTFNPAQQVPIDFPGYTTAGGGDIVFAYDKNGDLYCSWIYLLLNVNMQNYLDSCLFIGYWAKSSDNGQTFTYEAGDNHFFGKGKFDVQQLIVHDFGDGLCDREWMSVDLTNGPNANRLYIGYINYPFNMAETGLKVKSKLPNEAGFSDANLAYNGTGQFTNIGVDGNGILHYTFCDGTLDNVYHVSSSDGGQTFSNPHLIKNGVRLSPQSNYFLNERENAAPSLAIDGDNNLYLVWNEFPIGSFPTSFFSSSTDGGATWSNPVNLESLFDKVAFMPVVSAKGDNVTIGCYGVDADKKANYYIINSDNNAATFTDPLMVSSGITDFAQIGLAEFVGDYTTSTRTNCVIYNTWSDYRSGNRQYISKLDVCASAGVYELTPVESTYYLNLTYGMENKTITVDVKSSVNDVLLFEIYSLDGKKVYSRTNQIQEGTTVLTIPMSGFSNGKYLCYSSNQKGIVTTKLIEKF